MKKLLVAILSFLYISTSTGAIVQMHYCMGKLADWGFSHSNSKTCDKCGMEKSANKDKGCCKDENKFVKNNTDQKTAETVFQISQDLGVALPVSFYDIPTAHIPTITEENPISHAPPQSSATAVYILYCVFLI